MNKEAVQKQMEDYKNDLKASVENRDRLVGMLNQQETRIQQLMGAVAALEKILQKETENDENIESQKEQK